jgi:hypothetical protein
MIDRIVALLDGLIARGEAVKLHEIVWTVDASQHAILTVEEMNVGLAQVEGIAIQRDGDLVELVPDAAAKVERITDKDLENAMVLYRRAISGDL